MKPSGSTIIAAGVLARGTPAMQPIHNQLAIVVALMVLVSEVVALWGRLSRKSR